MRVVTRNIFLGCSLVLAACGDDGGGDNTDAPGGSNVDAPGGIVDAPGGTVDAATNVAPGPVTNFNADAGIALSWTNPTDADYSGTLIVVSNDTNPVSFSPVDGTTYTVGQVVGNGTVVAAANGTAATFGTYVPGLTHDFAAWAYDTGGLYSTEATTTGLDNDLTAQTATLSVDLTTQVVTVGTQPANLMLAGTAVYDDPNDTLTIDLGVTNNTARLLFNLKSLTTALNQGTQVGPVLQNAGNVPYKYYGPEALDVGAEFTRSIVITGVDGTVSPINLDLDFLDAKMLVASSSDLALIDSSGSREVSATNSGASTRQIVMTPDGKSIFAGSKNEGYVNIVDTRTLTLTEGVELGSGGDSGIGGVAITNNGADYYVGLNDGAHYNNGNTNDAILIKFDNTWTEVARIVLEDDVQDSTIRSIFPSPDESKIVVLAGSTAWFVDLTTFTVIDADTVTAGLQGVDIGSAAENGVWDDAGTTFFTCTRSSNPIRSIDTSTYAVTDLTPTTGTSRCGGITYTNGVLYVVHRRENRVTAFDISGGSQSDFNLGTLDGEINGIALTNGVIYVYERNPGPNGIRDVGTFDAATGAQLDLVDGETTNDIKSLFGRSIRNYGSLVSPF